MTAYAVRARLAHDHRPDVVIDSGVTFGTLDAAVAWMNGDDGEELSQSISIDVQRTDMDGYFCDDIVAIDADDPDWQPTGWPFDESHTYTAHLQFSARDDAHARLIAAEIHHLITAWQEAVDADAIDPLMILPQGYAIEAAHLTDADDWAEHVPAEDVCHVCSGPGTNRLRVGNGHRYCRECIVEHRQSTVYTIEDVAI